MKCADCKKELNKDPVCLLKGSTTVDHENGICEEHNFSSLICMDCRKIFLDGMKELSND